ncbi:hypothetical protein WME91_26855 [Sorangium sp. So ce269]
MRYYYDLVRDPRFVALEMRVVVDWGPGVLSWHQWALDKPVVELKDPNSLGPCPDYRDIDLSLAKLAFSTRHEEANPSWRDKLLAVGGIYLLTDRARGRLYVGQAGGETGFWGRWRAYADQRTGASRSIPPSTRASCARRAPRCRSSTSCRGARPPRWFSTGSRCAGRSDSARAPLVTTGTDMPAARRHPRSRHLHCTFAPWPAPAQPWATRPGGTRTHKTQFYCICI